MKIEIKENNNSHIKDKIYFVYSEETKPILDKDINWNCSCIPPPFRPGTPCYLPFALSLMCFKKSNQKAHIEKGSDCIDLFSKMEQCILKNPQLRVDLSSE